METDHNLDFECGMYWAVVEEASLAEVPRGVTDLLGGGREVVRGPWEAAACSARLLTWFDEGLIELYDDRAGHPTNRPDLPGPPATRHGPTGVLPASRARNLLADWQRWDDGNEVWQSTRLVLTDRGVDELREPTQLPPKP
jgi:hypothetical protein